MLNMNRRRGHGFTLVEIMIVVAIIGVLLAVAIPSYNRSRADAKLSTCKQNLRSISSALESYSTDKGQYPSSLNDLTRGEKPYLQMLPECPECGNNSSYIEGYEHATNPNMYTLRCHGENHTDCDLEANFPGYSPAIGGFERPDQIDEE